MKTLPIRDLLPGMVVEEPVYTSSGQRIVDSDTTLTSEVIYRLSFYSIPSVNIKETDAESDNDNSAASIPNPSRASNPSYSQKVKAQPEFMKYQIEYTKLINSIREVFDSVINHPELPVNTQKILDEFTALISMCRTTVDLLDKLHNMRLDDDSVYAHCLNVALLSRVIGKWLRFSPEERNILTLCGLFHDIGKTSIPDEILNKPGKYTDEEFVLIRQHPLFGYKILKNLSIDERIKKAALHHHERYDGSGYPQKLEGVDIDDYAGIIAIADVYDATTAARSYRSPLCPFQAIAMFEKEGLQKYNTQYILTFLDRIASTYQNNRVLLSSGQSATIVMINSTHLTKPMLQMDDGSIIDMQAQSDLEIVKII